MFDFLKKIFGSAQDRLIRKYTKIVKSINDWDEKFKSLSDEQIRAKTIEFKERLEKGEKLDDLLPEAYAVVKNACRRMCGTQVHVSGYDQKWDMVPFDVQLIGAIAMHRGTVVEMQTGEGKTLTATLPLYLNALTGKPVHLVTVNDYLAERDCQWTGSILRWLGLTTGSLTNDTPMEQRHSVYEADVVYGTSSEFGFDYLRDNSMASRKEEQVQRGFFYAIIDEADSILIDEARTPLIISGPVPVSRQLYADLKENVSSLVRRQRDLCNKLATEAKRALDLNSKDEEALRKLWLVSKGTPNNKLLKKAKEDPDLRAGIDKWDLYYYSDGNKEEKHDILAGLYIIIDEKSNEFELTDKGIAAWTEEGGSEAAGDDFVMLDVGYELSKIDHDPHLTEEERIQKRLEIQDLDLLRKERAHNLRQLLRAHLLMEKDVDYMIQEGKIVIIDENTGRAQPGRRFSDGLHQAIEAKEGVSIQKETQTYATITLQNFFRMYDKLAGMTGTIVTEAAELKQIYKIDVLAVPTHRKCLRDDFNDEIYMTEREKYNAIVKEITEVHGKGRPILVGTESVDVSEKLSRILKQNNLPHTVLNAKQNEKEAEIIAEAGNVGAIVISTNMAGRGTDIKLKAGVADLGGLYVLGTTRHQSRRIDRQLRGRSARQGDPGSSKFYISFEDQLMRLFASPRLTAVLQRFRPPEGEPISAKILNKSIETAQKRIEQRNYMIRKHTLEYDDVMNKQRQEIYAFRNDLIRTADVLPLAEQVLEEVCLIQADKFLASRAQSETWQPEAYRDWLQLHFPVSIPEGTFDDELADADELATKAATLLITAFREKMARELKKVEELKRTPGIVPNFPGMDEALRGLMIRKTDTLWQQHLLQMDHLRSDVNLRAVGQKDPLTEFKYESFALFDALSENLKTDIAHALFKFEIRVPTLQDLEQIFKQIQLERNRSFADELESTSDIAVAPEAPQDNEPRAGRNEDCPCGSQKKYKKCCGQYEPV
jgi:preprotein translocase subunit SecA